MRSCLVRCLLRLNHYIALLLAKLKDVTPKKDEPAPKAKKNRRVNFNFSMVKIAVGATLTFRWDQAITCKVVGDREIEFEGEVCSVGAAAKKILRRKGALNKSGAVRGPWYWLYDNESLFARRERIEKGEGHFNFLMDVAPKKDKPALQERKSRRKKFNFSMVKVPVGAILTFCKDKTITCKVVNDREIEFWGEICSLSAAATKVLRNKGTPIGKSGVSGPLYWCYENENLYARRGRMGV